MTNNKEKIMTSKLNTSTIKTILFGGLIVAMILPFGMDFAFAEIPADVKAKALEGKQIWEKLESMKKAAKLSTNASEITEEKTLQAKFDNIVKEMNKHGIATQEQWDSDPQYWRSLNLPPLPVSDTPDTTYSPSKGDLASTNTIEAMNQCGSCGPQELHVIAGFDYLLWGWWPTSAYSIHGWKTLTYDGDSDATVVTLEDDHSEITPHITQKIKKIGTVNYDYGYDARTYGGLLDANNSYGIIAIQVDPSSISITEDPLSNVIEDTTIRYDVDANWGISP